MQGENRYQFSQNMKTLLKNSLPEVLIAALALTLGLASAPNSQAQQGRYPGAVGGPAAPPTVDPATGLPIPVPDPSTQWKDPKWKDPDKVLDEAVYENLPLGEIASDLRKKFEDAFDVFQGLKESFLICQL